MIGPDGSNVDLLVTLHAILLIALPPGTLLLLVLVRRRRPRAIAALIATGICFLISFVSMSCKHLCREGNPYFQWVVPILCMLVILLFVAHKVLRRAAAIIMFALLILLCEQFHHWAHQQAWSGNPEGSRTTEKNFNNSKIKIAEMVLAGVADSDSTDYPAGWLNDLPPIQVAVAESKARIDLYCMGPAEYARCWHTWLTGLFRAQGKRDFWYLGGLVKNADGRIVVRERH